MDPITLGALGGALGGLLMALKPWAEMALKAEQEYRQEVRKAAQKMLEALDKTESYIVLGSDNPEKEAELVQAWHAAAVELSGLNNSLSELCYLKGEHWKTPDKLSKEEVQSAGFAIEQVKEAIRKLLTQNL